jgi:CPA2 family monovalent cation:H+ antiporter-2
VTLIGKPLTGLLAGVGRGGFSRRRRLNAGIALIAHGEFTVVLAQIAAANPRISPAVHSELLAFAGLYVLITATIGVALMKESKAIGRRLFAALPAGAS